MVVVDKDSEIQNDANDWSEGPRYFVDLVKRVARVSVETVVIIREPPELGGDMQNSQRSTGKRFTRNAAH